MSWNRREALVSLAAAAAGTALTPEIAEALQSEELTESQVEGLLRSLARVEPRAGEAAAVRTFLNELRGRRRTDPRVQPAFAFLPEVEP